MGNSPGHVHIPIIRMNAVLPSVSRGGFGTPHPFSLTDGFTLRMSAPTRKKALLNRPCRNGGRVEPVDVSWVTSTGERVPRVT